MSAPYNPEHYTLITDQDYYPLPEKDDMNREVTWTKNDMARVIVQALRHMDGPAPADNWEVLQIAKTHKKARLEELLNQAVENIHRRSCSV